MTNATLPHPPTGTYCACLEYGDCEACPDNGDCGCPTCDAYWSSGLDRPFVVLGNTTTERAAPLNLTPIDDTLAAPAAALQAAYEQRVAEDLAFLDFEPEPEPEPPENWSEIGKAANFGQTSEAASQWWVDPERLQHEGEPHPTTVTRDDGRAVIYADAVVWISGEADCGKSWVGLHAALTAAAAGTRALYWDLENQPRMAGERATLLGHARTMTDSSTFRYVHGETILHDYGDGEQAERNDWWAAVDWAELVVIDTAASLGCPDDGGDIRPWIKEYVTPFRDAGATVVVLDHLAKPAQGQTSSAHRGPKGNERKRSASDQSIVIPSQSVWNREHGGAIVLTNNKDRHGWLGVPRHKPFATYRGTWRDGAFSMEITAPTDDDTAPERDTVIEKRIIARLAAEGQITGIRDLKEAAKCGQAAALGAAARLIEKGLIERIPYGNAHAWVERAESQ